MNITSIRNKFDMLSKVVKYNINIPMVSETKLNSFFPQAQFMSLHLDMIREDTPKIFIREDIHKRRYSCKDNQYNTFKRFCRVFGGN